MLNTEKFNLTLKEIQEKIKNNEESFTKYSFEKVFNSLIFNFDEIFEFISEKDKYKLVTINQIKNNNNNFQFIFNNIKFDEFIDLNKSQYRLKNKFFIDIKNKIIYPLYISIRNREFQLTYDFEFIPETKHLIFLLNYEFLDSYETEAMSRNGGVPGGFYTPGWALPKARVYLKAQLYFNYIMNIDIFDCNIAKIKLPKYVFSKLLQNQDCSGFIVDYINKNGSKTTEIKLNEK